MHDGIVVEKQTNCLLRYHWPVGQLKVEVEEVLRVVEMVVMLPRPTSSSLRSESSSEHFDRPEANWDGLTEYY